MHGCGTWWWKRRLGILVGMLALCSAAWGEDVLGSGAGWAYVECFWFQRLCVGRMRWLVQVLAEVAQGCYIL